MLVSLLKWGILCVSLLAAALWLGLPNSLITIQFDQYHITSNIVNLVVIILIIYLPYRLFKRFFKRISKKIHTLSHVRNLIRLNNAIEKSSLDNSWLSFVLASDASTKDIKKLTHFLKILENSGSINAKFMVLQNKINKSLLVVYYKALVLEFIKNKDYENIGFFCQKGLALKQNGWFAYQLVLIYINNTSIKDLMHYKKIFKTLSFHNKQLEKQTYCLINWFLANNLYTQGDYKRAYDMALDITHIYPDFLPAYKILFNINSIQQNKSETKHLLKDMWKNNKNYYAIDLWVRFNVTKKYKSLLEELNNIFKDDDLEINKLLTIALSIDLGEYLAASELLSTISDDNELKNIFAIHLAQKELKIPNINGNIQKIIDSNFNNAHWWFGIIN